LYHVNTNHNCRPSKGEVGIFPAAYAKKTAPPSNSDETPSSNYGWDTDSDDSHQTQQPNNVDYTENFPTSADDLEPIASSESIQKTNKMLSKSRDSYILGTSRSIV
jgi:hypothetical protein